MAPKIGSTLAKETQKQGDDLRDVQDDLWRRAAQAQFRLLMLDYDGTLAPFCVSRATAWPAEGIREQIERIAARGRTTVAIVSGRPIAQLDQLLSGVPAHLVGEHGWEIRLRGEPIVRYPLAAPAAEALGEAMEAAEGADWRGSVERKHRSLVLHTRGLDDAAKEEAEAASVRLWTPIAAHGGVALKSIDGGLELRAKGRDKGTAVQFLIETCHPGVLPVYVGDDETDEDAFRVVGRIGYGVRVGSGGRPSLATSRVGSCAAVRSFLERWTEEVDGTASAGRNR